MFVVVVVCLFSLVYCLFVCLFLGEGGGGGGGGLYFFCTLKSPLKSLFLSFFFISPFFPSLDSYTIRFCLLTSGVELSIWRTSISSAYVAKSKKQKETFQKTE